MRLGRREAEECSVLWRKRHKHFCHRHPKWKTHRRMTAMATPNRMA